MKTTQTLLQLKEVLSSGNHYLGTVRTNKRGLPPKEFHFQKTGRNKNRNRIHNSRTQSPFQKYKTPADSKSV